MLARRLGYALAKLHIREIPIGGVAFQTFKKVLDANVLGIPIALITDADPPVPTNESWKDAIHEAENGEFKLCDRTHHMQTLFVGHATVKVFSSRVTLEYDLAEAGDDNAGEMPEVWKACFPNQPRTFNS